jgi:hypothetical protein
MGISDLDIVRRDFKHNKLAYGFQWNRTHHKRFGISTGESASLWAHLTTIHQGKIPEKYFSDPFFSSASSLRFKKMSSAEKIRFRKKLERTGALVCTVDDDLVQHIRDMHRDIDDTSYRADHSILPDFLTRDPSSIAVEVPVWSDRFNMTGHIDLVRLVDGVVQVCDYKPGPLDSTSKRFLDAIPQVVAYGEMMTMSLASTLRSALEVPLLPKVKCCIFDTHSSWHYGAELFVTFEAAGMISGL